MYTSRTHEHFLTGITVFFAMLFVFTTAVYTCAEDPSEDEYQEEQLCFHDRDDEEEHQALWTEIASFGFGEAGRLYSEDIQLNVGLYHQDMYSGTNWEAQRITDAPDAALWMDYHLQTALIGDHYNQGFEVIKQSVPGETKLYIANQECIAEYLCDDFQNGTNSGTDILDEDGNSIIGQDKGGLWLYTCNGDWRHIALASYKLTAVYPIS